MAMENPQRHWTVAEYLAYEESSGIKHEYIDGEIFAMTGGSDKHSRIKANCVVEIGYQLREKPCRLYDSDMKTQISEEKYVYPNFSVVCKTPKFANDSETMLLNPILVAEVMSPSSASYDSSTKAGFYRGLEAVQIYLLIAQDKQHVQMYIRQNNGWFFQEFTALDDVIQLKAIDCTLPLAEIYRDINYTSETA